MADAGNGTIPRLHSYTALVFTRGGWSALLANTYISGVTDDDDGESVKYYTSWDGALSYTFSQSDPGGQLLKGLMLKVGCNDLFNRQPSNDYDTFSWRRQCFDISTCVQPDCTVRLRGSETQVLILPKEARALSDDQVFGAVLRDRPFFFGRGKRAPNAAQTRALPSRN